MLEPTTAHHVSLVTNAQILTHLCPSPNALQEHSPLASSSTAHIAPGQNTAQTQSMSLTND